MVGGGEWVLEEGDGRGWTGDGRGWRENGSLRRGGGRGGGVMGAGEGGW